ncbi:hypothetical protein BJX70DRAFT_404639 [Aspergillus crustosus]
MTSLHSGIPICPRCNCTVYHKCITEGHLLPCDSCGHSFSPITHATCRTCTPGTNAENTPWDHEAAMQWLEKQNQVAGPNADADAQDTGMDLDPEIKEEDAAMVVDEGEADLHRMDAAEAVLMLSRGDDKRALAVQALTTLKWQGLKKVQAASGV